MNSTLQSTSKLSLRTDSQLQRHTEAQPAITVHEIKVYFPQDSASSFDKDYDKKCYSVHSIFPLRSNIPLEASQTHTHACKCLSFGSRINFTEKLKKTPIIANIQTLTMKRSNIKIVPKARVDC